MSLFVSIALVYIGAALVNVWVLLRLHTEPDIAQLVAQFDNAATAHNGLPRVLTC